MIVIEDKCIVTIKPVALFSQAIAELVQNGDYLFFINPTLSADYEESVTPYWTASNSLGAPEDTQTSFNFNESYIGSLEATINSDFINIRL